MKVLGQVAEMSDRVSDDKLTIYNDLNKRKG